MNKKFEQEYRKMMEAKVPDLWDRIEKGVNESERANSVIEFKASRKSKDISDVKSEGKKVRYSNYQLRALAGVAACFVLLMIGIPAVRQSMETENEAQVMGQAAAESGSKGESTDKEASQIENDNATADVPECQMAEALEDSAGNGRSEVAQTEDSDKTSTPVKEDVLTASEEQSEPMEAETSESEVDVNTETDNAVETEITDEKPIEKSDSGRTSSSVKNKTKGSESVPIYKEDGVVAGSDSKAAVKTDSSSNKVVKATSSDTKKTTATGVNKTTDSDKNKITSSSANKTTSSSNQKNGSSSKKQSSKKRENNNSTSKRNAAAGDRANAPEDMSPQTPVNAPESEAPEKQETVTIPVNYSGVQVKVTSIKKKDNGVVYTVKVMSDSSEFFKENTKLLLVSSKEMKKKSKYIIAFTDDGTKNDDNKTVYSVIDIEEIMTENE